MRKMHILVITIFLVLNTYYVTPLHKKCCDTESYLHKNNSIYFCDKDEDKRLQIFTNETNFLQSANEGTCLDSHMKITEYKIRNRTVVEERPMPVNFYPKCCPLGYFYHTTTHSCVWRDDIDEGFITQNFIKVGLPHCQLIVDYNLTPWKYRLELGNLYIEESVKFQEGQFCIDKSENDSLIARGCHRNLSVCYNGVKCIHKCCPDGQSFVGGKNCKNTYEHGVDLSFTDRVNNSQEPFAIVHGYDCRMYIMKKKIQFYIDPNGTFFGFSNKTNSFEKYEVAQKSYCIEHVHNKKMNTFQFMMCFPDDPMQGKFVAARWAKIISCIFVVLTMAVYLFLPEMLNLFGKILLSYCTCMFTVFAFLTYAQFQTKSSDETCVITSFLASYMSLASFSWLNVMCFNIWWTFGTPKSFLTAKERKSELKRFLLYCLYGWGLPAIITVISVLAYSAFETPSVIAPILGSFKCFWERRKGNYGMFLYYVTPLIVMEIANLVFFLRTVHYCLKVKGEINKLNDNRLSAKEKRNIYNVDKEQLLLVLKLSVAMGLSFAFEVVSSLWSFDGNVTTEYIEIIWDTINCLQGVFIFLIFICKKKVFRLCCNRIMHQKDRKISVSSLPTGTTQVTESLNSKSKLRNV